jgi:hypothetical protein
MLAGHPDIHTDSESWLMLQPLYILKDSDAYQAEYDAKVAVKAVKHFLSKLPEGAEEWVRGIRSMYGRLYAKALEGSGKRFFLDKTPRYYLILPELHNTFPQAHLIILMRNPLAVLCSIVRTWVKGKWHRLHRYSSDLIKAPRLLVSATQSLAPHALAVSYEELLKNPDQEMRRICEWVGIEFLPEMIEYAKRDLSRWSLGDQQTVYQHARPSPANLDSWLLALDDAQTWRLADEYLDFLGDELVCQMGYDFGELKKAVKSRRPNVARLWFTSSMAKLLSTHPTFARIEKEF